MRRKAALRSSGAPVGASVVERIGSGLGSCFSRDSLEGVVVMEREGGCERWLMANAGVVGVETRLFRGERSEARWRLERSVVRKAGRMSVTWPGFQNRLSMLYSREALDTGKHTWDYSLELDRKPGILSPMALTFSKSQSLRISISETLIVGRCS